jgi:hypothetical protein
LYLPFLGFSFFGGFIEEIWPGVRLRAALLRPCLIEFVRFLLRGNSHKQQSLLRAQRKAAGDGVFGEPGLVNGVSTLRLSEFVMTRLAWWVVGS